MEIPDNVFQYLFGKTYQQLRDKVIPKGIALRTEQPKKRYTAIKGLSHPRIERPDEQIQEEFLQLADIPLEQPYVEYGPDIDPELADNPTQDPQPAPVLLDSIWRQFPVDILQKSGNPRSHLKPSYCILDHCKRRCIKLEEFNTPRLSNLFSHVQIKDSTESEWNKTFNHLFPPQSHICPPKAYHYPQAKYYLAWKELMSRVTPENAQKLRASMKVLFDELTWDPAESRARLWSFGAEVGFNVVPEDAMDTAARIIWNPYGSGEAVVWGNPHVIARPVLRIEDVRKEEEEESSHDEEQ